MNLGPAPVRNIEKETPQTRPFDVGQIRKSEVSHRSAREPEKSDLSKEVDDLRAQIAEKDKTISN